MRGVLTAALTAATLVCTLSAARADTKISYGTYLPPTHVNMSVETDLVIRRGTCRFG